jgi:hypothetical protein
MNMVMNMVDLEAELGHERGWRNRNRGSMPLDAMRRRSAE